MDQRTNLKRQSENRNSLRQDARMRQFAISSRWQAPNSVFSPQAPDSAQLPLPPALVDRRHRGIRTAVFQDFNRRFRAGGPHMTSSVHSLNQPPRFTHYQEQFRPNKLYSARSQPQVYRSGSQYFTASREYLPHTSVYCAFCRSNREPQHVYTSHWLKDVDGRVVCPILRKYVCKRCGATGDNAHTDSYCPRNPLGSRSMKSVLTTSKTSSGKLRR